MTQIAWPPDGGIHIHLNLAPPEPAPKSAVPVIDQLRVKAIDGQLQRLNRWLAEHSRQDYEDSFSDTADAMIAAADRLRGQVARLSDPGALVERDKLRIELATAIAERDASDSLLATLADWLAVHGDDTDPRNEVDLAIILMESQSAEIKRLNAELAILRSDATATPHGNGKSSVAAAAAAIQAADLPEQYPPAIAAAMNAVAVPVEQAADVIAQEAATVQIADDPDPELSDYIIGLDAGRHTWRTIPKPVRWRLVRSVLRSIWTDGKLPTMDDFDKHAPAWMPTANACATTFGDGKWTVMCEKAIEP